MSLDDKVHTALKDLIDQGLVQGFHTSRHAPFVEGGPTPDEVNVLAVLSVREPEEHRHDIEGRLHDAGLGKVVLRLHRGPISVNQPSEEPNTHIPADVTDEDEMRIRERAYLLWEAEGNETCAREALFSAERLFFSLLISSDGMHRAILGRFWPGAMAPGRLHP